MKKFLIITIVVLGIFFSYSRGVFAASCDFTIQPTEDMFRGTDHNLKGGETICIPAGTRSGISFYDVVGTPTKPIIIRNEGGVAILGNTPGKNAGINLFQSKHLRITGTGSSDFYGIKLQDAFMGMNVANAKGGGGYEFDHLDISTSSVGFAGIMIKADGARGTIEDGVYIHDNYIHDTEGECIYLGQTKTSFTNAELDQQLFRNVRITNNIGRRCGWDGFQVANVNGVEINNNVIHTTGVKTTDSVQRTALQIGDNSKNVKVHHNVFTNSNQNALPIFGGGSIEVYSNYIANTPSSAFFIDNRSVAEQNSTISIHDNFIKNIKENIFGIYNEVNYVNIYKNKIDGKESDLVRYSSNAGPQGTNKVSFTENSFTSVEAVMFSNNNLAQAPYDFILKSGTTYANLGLGLSSIVTTQPAPVPIPTPYNPSRTASLFFAVNNQSVGSYKTFENENLSLSWSTSDIKTGSCRASSSDVSWGGILGDNGSRALLRFIGTQTYIITCTGLNNLSVSKSITITSQALPKNSQTKFSKNSSIKTLETVKNLRVRNTPFGKILGLQKPLRLGTIVDGPQVSGGITWWKVNFKTGFDGWVAEQFIEKY